MNVTKELRIANAVIAVAQLSIGGAVYFVAATDKMVLAAMAATLIAGLFACLSAVGNVWGMPGPGALTASASIFAISMNRPHTLLFDALVCGVALGVIAAFSAMATQNLKGLPHLEGMDKDRVRRFLSVQPLGIGTIIDGVFCLIRRGSAATT